MEKKKKVTIIMSHNYDGNNIASNDKIADRIKRDLLKNLEPKRERIESIIVEDMRG